jgi:hypothetical protein
MNGRVHIHTILSGLLLAGILFVGCAQAKAGQPAAEPSRALEATATAAPLAEATTAPVAVEIETPSADMPEEAEAAEPQWVGTCHSLLDELPYAVDVDLDGRMELLDLRAIPGADEYSRWAIVLTKDGEEQLFQTEIPCDMPHDLWLGDLNEDGAYELFFHGDMASDDYLIYALHSDLTPIPFEPDDRYANWLEEQDNTIFGGYIDGFEDDHIVIEGVVDMLGTHFGVRNFAIGDDGIIGPVSSVWQFDEEDRPLTVIRELTAYRAAVRKEPGEAFALLPGERIVPLASDGCERMWFETAEGKGGVLLLTRDEETMWRIDGVPEAEYFEFLPYSG